MAYFKEYPFIKEHIDASYDVLLSTLKEITIIVDQLFVTQIHPKYGVYPEKINELIKDHPTFQTQPFSVTCFDESMLHEVPYHIHYEKAFKKIINLLRHAQKDLESIEGKIDRKWWKEYFQVLESAFEQDTWEDAEKFYLTINPQSPILFCVGPIDTYHDKVFGTKRYFSAWLLVQDAKQQKIAMNLWNDLTEISKSEENVKLYVGNLLYSGGEVAKHNSMGWSRPENVTIAQTHGSLKLVALNQLSQETVKMEVKIKELLNKSSLSHKSTNALLSFHNELAIVPLLLHEFGHTYHKEKNAHALLHKYYQLLEELRANTNMVALAYQLEQKGKLPKDSAKNTFLRAIFYVDFLYNEFLTKNHREVYLFASLLWIKFAEEHKILVLNRDFLEIDERKLKKDLMKLVEEILSYLHDLTLSQTNQEEIGKLKKDVFDYGAHIKEKIL